MASTTTARADTGQRTACSAADGIRLTRRGETVGIYVDLTGEKTPDLGY